MEQISTSFNLSYDIPRILISAPGRQNRSGDGRLRITPGMTEPVEFVFGNHDGVKLNLVPFQIKLVFWRSTVIDSNLSGIGQSDVILAKVVPIDDPYSGKAMVILTGQDTQILGHSGSRSLSWGVFLINANRDVFPCVVSSSGARSGQVLLDLTSGTPLGEIIASL